MQISVVVVGRGGGYSEKRIRIKEKIIIKLDLNALIIIIAEKASK